MKNGGAGYLSASHVAYRSQDGKSERPLPSLSPVPWVPYTMPGMLLSTPTKCPLTYVKEKNDLALVTKVRKTLFRTIEVDVKTVTIGDTDWAPHRIQ